MEALPVEHVIAVLLEQLTEAYEGPTDEYTWFINNQPDGGLFRSVAPLSAELASASPVPGGATIAAHVEHLRWTLMRANAFVRGEQPSRNWAESWSVRTVDQAGWERLQHVLQHEYRTLHDAIAAQRTEFKPEHLGGTMSLIAHAAYHLGAIRQMIKSLQSRDSQ